jgi:hypothetical protein
LIDLNDIVVMLELISKLSPAGRRDGCRDPRNAVSCATDL